MSDDLRALLGDKWTSKEEAMSDDMPRICVDCEWTDVQDLWEPVARRVLVRPCPQHTDMEEDQ